MILFSRAKLYSRESISRLFNFDETESKVILTFSKSLSPVSLLLSVKLIPWSGVQPPESCLMLRAWSCSWARLGVTGACLTLGYSCEAVAGVPDTMTASSFSVVSRWSVVGLEASFLFPKSLEKAMLCHFCQILFISLVEVNQAL